MDKKYSAGDVLARLTERNFKNKRYYRWFTKSVAELFEARKPKDSAIIAENDGQVIEFGKEVRGKQKISIVAT